MPHSIPPTSDIGRQYAAVPVPRDFIPSKGTTTPQILWVGCSDSLSTEPDALDLLPEETFIHRNLGNILSNGDLSSASAIEWAVNLLKVRLSVNNGDLSTDLACIGRTHHNLRSLWLCTSIKPKS